MIKVKILVKEDKEIIQITGHANFDQYGKDIVCSATSAIVLTTVNAIMMFNKDYIHYLEQNDMVTIEIRQQNEITSNLITNMLNLLKELENDYPNNIKIKEEI